MSFLSSLFGIAPATPHAGIIFADQLRVMLPGAIMGKTEYALVRDDYCLGACKRALTALSKNVGGIRSWQASATCTLFAANAVANSAQEYYAAAFHDDNPAPALAVAEVWYRPDKGGGHAIVAFVTPLGPCYVDPQTPDKLVTLTKTEFASRYLTRFL